MEKKRKHPMLLVLASLIWGIAFVAQREGGGGIGPYCFNGLRFFMGAAVLVPVIAVSDRVSPSPERPVTKAQRRLLYKAAAVCGLFLCIASNFQQVALTMGAAAGKAGFLTACYILLVPILGLVFRRKCGWNVWLAVAIALVGLYLLCLTGSLRLSLPDLLLLLCALFFAFQILAIDHFAPQVDGVRLSCLEFLVAGVLTVPLALGMDLRGTELRSWTQELCSRQTLIPLLYTGILSSGAGYTLQILGQRNVDPTVASLLMSLESVFSVLAGWALLHERLTGRELLGCGLIFAAIILAQLELKPLRKKG